MRVDVLIEDARWSAVDIDAIAQAAAEAVLAHLDLSAHETEIDLLACDDARIAELNSEFRDKPTPTNVLSWPAEELRAAQDGARPDAPEPDMGVLALGDIAIAFDTCEREAKAQDKQMSAHVTHLVVHGLLHLLGYDHIRDLDATLMEGMESEILGNMGLDDPYNDE